VDQGKFLDNILEQFKAVANKHFPNFISDGYGYAGPRFHINLSGKASTLENTPYYYHDELKFVHWTSIENLVSIINNQEIRLYNLINSDDEQEFEYSAKALDLDDRRIRLIKENYFTFSFCKKNELNNPHLWKTYGKDFSGVAIEFSIVNKPENWSSYLVSKISYEFPDVFAAYQKDINILKRKYNNEIELDFDIWRFAGFHKAELYQPENEVRLSVCFPFKYTDDRLKIARNQFRIDGKRNRIVTYIPLQLWIGFEKAYPKDFYPKGELQMQTEKELAGKPHIKIDNIHFGPNCKLTNLEYGEYRDALQEMISFQLGYSLDLPLNLFDINAPA
jgi:hypothetical protein